MRGRTIFSDVIWNVIGRRFHLSHREFDIVQAIFDDETEYAISRQLGISRHTVHTHIERLYQKLGVGSRTQLVVCVVSEYVSQRRSPQPISLE